MGVYEAILGVVALLGTYVVWALVRLVRLARKRSPEAKDEQGGDEAMLVGPDKESVEPKRSGAERVERAEPGAGRDGFESMIELARLRFQVEAQETTLSALRSEMAALYEKNQTEIAELREQIEMLRNANNVSPQYGEAVGLAQRGLDSDAIAERCGISVSEAELVAALSRGATKE